jgi:hypothetical protein
MTSEMNAKIPSYQLSISRTEFRRKAKEELEKIVGYVTSIDIQQQETRRTSR